MYIIKKTDTRANSKFLPRLLPQVSILLDSSDSLQNTLRIHIPHHCHLLAPLVAQDIFQTFTRHQTIYTYIELPVLAQFINITCNKTSNTLNFNIGGATSTHHSCMTETPSLFARSYRSKWGPSTPRTASGPTATSKHTHVSTHQGKSTKHYAQGAGK